METGGAVNGGGSTGGAFQLGNLHTLAQRVHNILGSQLGAGHVVGSNLAVDLNTVDSAVDRDDLDALGFGSLHSAGDSVGVNGIHDQHADALGHQILNVADLLGHVITGIDHGQIHARGSGSLLGALGQSDEEGVVLGGDGQADGAAGGLGLGGSRGLFTVNGDTAGGQ